jgi:two-component system sensor histidine kinase UhpB
MRRRHLITQVLIVNLLLMVAAVVAAIVAANPNVNLSERPEAGLVLGFATGFTILFNVFLLQRRVAPLEDLVDQMERTDLTRPGATQRIGESPGGSEEVERLYRAFVRMIERLELERRGASSVALDAQEEERARVARDLHDEVNQSLTGLLLRLEATRERSPPELASELAEIRSLANQAMQELLTLARQLRPTALDDLGLAAALSGLVDDLDRQGSVHADFESEGEFGEVPQDVQVVVYRVAQEALSNAIRHSEARHLRVRLVRDNGTVDLSVGDDGRGFTFDQASRGLGLAGMRERALLVGGDLQVTSRPQAGTSVRLRVPIRVEDEVPGR